ncbi:YqgQ family protein [Pseudogracilibacillus sp. SE30717A]|uniref:YqgQ family protein n=1 Tax=Pseudogracilibacillus sp. SE30717A TaxID=3098293 RepID=UPI00300E6B87
MKTVYDVRTILKRFGIFIYTGNRIADLELMQTEIRDLYNAHIIDIKMYQQAILVLKSEISEENNKV